MRICELHNKQVINTCDCKILGCVADVEFNECTGCIQSLIVPGPGKLFCFFRAGNRICHSVFLCALYRSGCRSGRSKCRKNS